MTITLPWCHYKLAFQGWLHMWRSVLHIYAGSVVEFVDHINVQNIKNKQTNETNSLFL